MVHIPFFAEQARNAYLAHARNISIVMDKFTLDDDDLAIAIKTILGDDSYKFDVNSCLF